MIEIPTLLLLIFLIVYIITVLTFIISWIIFMYSAIRLYYTLATTKGAWKKAHKWYIIPTWNNLFLRLDRDFSNKRIIYYNNKTQKWLIIMVSTIVIIAIFITIIILFGRRYMLEVP